MKKFLIFVITILYAGIAFGEDSSISTANTESKVLIDNHGVYNSKVIDSPITNKIDPLNLGTTGAYRNKSERKASADEDFNRKDMDFLFNKKNIKVKLVEAYSFFYLINDAIKTGFSTIDQANDEISMLAYYPTDDDVIQVSTVHVDKESCKKSLEREICTGIWKAFLKSGNAKYFTIKYEASEISQNSGIGFGGGTSITKAPGGDTVYNIAGTIGAAMTKANSFHGGYFDISFWNKCPKNAIAPTDTKTEVVRKNQIEILNIENVKEVFFELNSYELKEKSQFEAIESMVIFIDNHIQNLQPNQIFCIFGKASKPGTKDLNRDLGWNRAEKTYIHVLRDLHNKKGYELSYLKSKIQFATNGKAFPYHEKDEHNQEACLKVLQN